MLENYITQVRRPKGVLSEREAFVSRAAQASAAACNNSNNNNNSNINNNNNNNNNNINNNLFQEIYKYNYKCHKGLLTSITTKQYITLFP